MYKIKIADNLLQGTETEFYCSCQHIPAILGDTVIQESKIRSTNRDIILPFNSSEFNQINFAIQTRSRQIYSRSKVLITSCRKQRRTSIALASSIQTILEDIVIHESKTKSINIDISVFAESAEFIGLTILQLETKSPRCIHDQEC